MLGKLAKTTLLGFTVLASTALFNAAEASESRTPIRSSSVRETTAKISSYENEIKIVRHRSIGKAFASFYADPQLIQKDSVVVFEIKSYAKSASLSRWRCVATHDIAECLGAPVKIQYLPKDTRIEMTFKLKPRMKRQSKKAYAQR